MQTWMDARTHERTVVGLPVLLPLPFFSYFPRFQPPALAVLSPFLLLFPLALLALLLLLRRACATAKPLTTVERSGGAVESCMELGRVEG